MNTETRPVLEVRDAHKRFGAVHALKGVGFRAYRGEVLALLGDNGAGKSTLIKCVSGVHEIDEGEILLDGQSISIRSPAAARTVGIETVYQDLALFDNLTPAQNFYCGREIAGRNGCRAVCVSCAACRWTARPLRSSTGLR